MKKEKKTTTEKDTVTWNFAHNLSALLFAAVKNWRRNACVLGQQAQTHVDGSSAEQREQWREWVSYGMFGSRFIDWSPAADHCNYTYVRLFSHWKKNSLVTRLYGKFSMIHNAEFIIKIEHFYKIALSWNGCSKKRIQLYYSCIKWFSYKMNDQRVDRRKKSSERCKRFHFCLGRLIIYRSVDLMRFFGRFSVVRSTTCI